MSCEDIVTVKAKDGGSAHFSMGMGHTLTLGPGESSDKWAEGSPITRGEFKVLLSRDGAFEIVEPKIEE